MMMKKLRAKSFKNHIVGIIISAALLAFGLVMGGKGMLSFVMGPKALNSLPVDKLEGQYVEAEVGFLYDTYAYTTERKSGQKGVTVAKEYIMDVGDWEYMGVEMPKAMLKQSDKLLEDSWAVITGEAQEYGTPFVVRGTIMRMDAETLDFYHETLGYDTLDKDDQGLFLPLVLKVNKIGGLDLGSLVMYSLMAAVGLFWLVWALLRVFTGAYEKSVTQYCQASGNPEAAMEEVEAFYENTEEVCGIRMNDRMMMFTSNGHTILLDPSDVVWAYQSTTQHRTNGIPTGKTYSLNLATRGGKKYVLGMANEAAVKTALDLLFVQQPHVMLGYNAKYPKMYSKQRDEFLCLAAETARLQHTPVPAGSSESGDSDEG